MSEQVLKRGKKWVWTKVETVGTDRSAFPKSDKLKTECFHGTTIQKESNRKSVAAGSDE
jgi:hypothetical protein